MNTSNEVIQQRIKLASGAVGGPRGDRSRSITDLARARSSL